MIAFLTTADTEILAAAAAVERLPDGFPPVRCANPARPPSRRRCSTTCCPARGS